MANQNKRPRIAPGPGMRTLEVKYRGEFYEVPISLYYIYQLKQVLGVDVLKRLSEAGDGAPAEDAFDEMTAVGMITAALRSLGGEFKDLTVEETARNIPFEDTQSLMDNFLAAMTPDIEVPSKRGNPTAPENSPGDSSGG